MPGASPVTSDIAIDAASLSAAVARIWSALGVDAADAETVAADLVAADLEGIPSHGVMLVPLYVERLISGSVSRHSRGNVVNDSGGAIVIDGLNALGQLTARQAVKLAVERAKELGLSAVAVRNAFHFGTAGRYARLMAEQNCIGIVMSNTRPLLAAPGGAEALVGNNPIAIALPSAGDFPVEVDMALSASAMGKIRLAAAAGKSIPADWAVDSNGRPTTDPAEAIKGILLPAAGPKGFGLAFIIDLLCGGLSNGAVGVDVHPLYGNAAVPYGCAHFFLAIHPGHFVPESRFRERVHDAGVRASRSKRSPGVERVYAPGELVWATRRASKGICVLDSQIVRSLAEAAARVGIKNFEDTLSKTKGVAS
jgi:LDH2 family malate/lactate/ureidoglycolate dehydrogenase